MDEAKEAIDATLGQLKAAVEQGDHVAAEAYARVLLALRDLALMHL